MPEGMQAPETVTTQGVLGRAQAAMEAEMSSAIAAGGTIESIAGAPEIAAPIPGSAPGLTALEADLRAAETGETTAPGTSAGDPNDIWARLKVGRPGEAAQEEVAAGPTAEQIMNEFQRWGGPEQAKAYLQTMEELSVALAQGHRPFLEALARTQPALAQNVAQALRREGAQTVLRAMHQSSTKTREADRQARFEAFKQTPPDEILGPAPKRPSSPTVPNPNSMSKDDVAELTPGERMFYEQAWLNYQDRMDNYDIAMQGRVMAAKRAVSMMENQLDQERAKEAFDFKAKEMALRRNQARTNVENTNKLRVVGDRIGQVVEQREAIRGEMKVQHQDLMKNIVESSGIDNSQRQYVLTAIKGQLERDPVLANIGQQIRIPAFQEIAQKFPDLAHDCYVINKEKWAQLYPAYDKRVRTISAQVIDSLFGGRVRTALPSSLPGGAAAPVGTTLNRPTQQDRLTVNNFAQRGEASLRQEALNTGGYSSQADRLRRVIPRSLGYVPTQ